jgi:hypothetical protein
MTTVHIAPYHNRGWVITYVLGEPPSVVFERKQEAILAAQKISKKNGCSILLHETLDGSPTLITLPKKRERILTTKEGNLCGNKIPI